MPDQYNVAILQIDSTSRNQFFRHNKETLQFMVDNDFTILNNYVKVGDNSAINTFALLAGKVFEVEIRNVSGYVERRDYLNENETMEDITDYVTFAFDVMKGMVIYISIC